MDRKPHFSIPHRTSSRAESPEKGKSPFILERTASRSKSPEKRRALSPRKHILDLSEELRQVKDKATMARKRIRLRTSYDSDYWTARHQVAMHDLESTKLQKELSIAQLDITKDNFLQTEEGIRLLTRQRSFELDVQLYQTQAEKMANTSQEFEIRKAFASLFIGAKTGWGINNSPVESDKDMQIKFGNDLIDAMGSRHKDPQRPDEIWCPITRGWYPRSFCTAAHLFPRTAGESTMEAIFGETKDENGNSDLWKPACGMLWSTDAEHRFTKGSFTIVPNVADNPTVAEIEAWDASKVKDYKIRVVSPKDASMNFKICRQDKSWLQLDGQKVLFLTDWRPKARYLYFAYCEAMLRRTFAEGKHQEFPERRLASATGAFQVDTCSKECCLDSWSRWATTTIIFWRGLRTRKRHRLSTQ